MEMYNLICGILCLCLVPLDYYVMKPLEKSGGIWMRAVYFLVALLNILIYLIY